jgi:LEA14-like dessication related protein
MLERIVLAVLAVLTLLFGYSLVVASERFGDATQTFDQVEFELIDFDYVRGERTVDFSMRVTNPAVNDLTVVYIEYPFIVNGVVAGGGDIRPGTVLEPGESHVFELQGRVNDMNYIERLDPDEPIRWLVTARMQVNVDERLDSEFIPFSFRSETP